MKALRALRSGLTGLLRRTRLRSARQAHAGSTDEALQSLFRNLYGSPDFLWLKSSFGGHFFAPNQLCVDRVRYCLEKERDTIAWLDRLPAGATFWDIGANIGIYSIYAAFRRNLNVVAFEPGAFPTSKF